MESEWERYLQIREALKTPVNFEDQIMFPIGNAMLDWCYPYIFTINMDGDGI